MLLGKITHVGDPTSWQTPVCKEPAFNSVIGDSVFACVHEEYLASFTDETSFHQIKCPSDQLESPLTRRSWQSCSQRDTQGCRHHYGWRTRGSQCPCCAPSPACICCEDLGRRRKRRSASLCRWSGFQGSAPHSCPRAGGHGRPHSDWLSWASDSRPGTGRGSTGHSWCRLDVCSEQDTLQVGEEEQYQVREENFQTKWKLEK